MHKFENIHKGEDIYIIAAGKTTDYYAESFFNNRVTIGVNNVWLKFKNIDYNIYRDTPPIQCSLDVPNIVSEYRGSNKSWGKNSEHLDESRNVTYFSHNQNEGERINMSGVHPHGDKLAVSFSTITSAIHLAAFMGARAVFLVGHDCAILNDRSTMDGYPMSKEFAPYNRFMSEIFNQTILMRDYLKKEYSAEVITLSPFVGLKHEGHVVE